MKGQQPPMEAGGVARSGVLFPGRIFSLARGILDLSDAPEGGRIVTFREVNTALHGIAGVLFLMAFSGGLAGLWSFQRRLLTEDGIKERIRRLKWGTSLMAVAAWVTVIWGAVVYTWYRAPVPESPRSLILGGPQPWVHTFGMEWKEHVALFVPILATAAAYLIWFFQDRLVIHRKARRVIIAVFALSAAFGGVAFTLGALVTKTAPLH
ncbi:MAG: hypothetical protein HYY08_01570 [Firmicutes bacterium]|nr:hypothetical protein [Bacillota bacterium]